MIYKQKNRASVRVHFLMLADRSSWAALGNPRLRIMYIMLN